MSQLQYMHVLSIIRTGIKHIYACNDRNIYKETYLFIIRDEEVVKEITDANATAPINDFFTIHETFLRHKHILIVLLY